MKFMLRSLECQNAQNEAHKVEGREGTAWLCKKETPFSKQQHHLCNELSFVRTLAIKSFSKKINYSWNTLA